MILILKKDGIVTEEVVCIKAGSDKLFEPGIS